MTVGHPMVSKKRVVLAQISALTVLLSTFDTFASAWRGEEHRSVLRNESVRAVFQGGWIQSLTDTTKGKELLSVDPGALPNNVLIFDQKPSDLDSAVVRTSRDGNDAVSRYRFPGGFALQIHWSIEPGDGDLILKLSTRTPGPVEVIRYNLLGCDIEDHALVWIHGYGTATVRRAPWNEFFLGDPQRDGPPSAFPHPVVTLFQGNNAGWFIEGRDPRIGPANVMVKGTGNRANLGMVRRFAPGEKDPQLYEVRIRTYERRWENAVAPYVDWLEEGAGLVNIDKLPEPQAWVKEIRSQAYITVGDYETIEALARRVDPSKTFIGRQAEHRAYAFDIGYPDYRLTEDAKQWMRRVRELGFHVGVHYNCNAIGTEFPELVERFRPGFAVTGKDADGKDTYQSLYQGRLIRCSSAYKPWRDYLVAQMKDAVDAGVDVIYLDECMAPTGKFVVDGMNGIEGIQALMRETLAAYPHVAIESEQFNLLTAKYGKFALSQMPLGHALSSCIFQRFVKVVPEGVMYSPVSSKLMNAHDTWGCMLPGAHPGGQQTWLEIAEAFQEYDLVPDHRLPRMEPVRFEEHYTHGITPVYDEVIPEEGQKMFGFRGRENVTAYFERHPTRRGLVVYEPGHEPRWFGMRHFGVRRYTGPGVPSYYGFRQYMKDWIIYDEDSLLGLNPEETYMFDAAIDRPQDRFHVTSVPDDFTGYYNMERRIDAYEIGMDDSFFRLVFAGHGAMKMHVPDEYDVYMDGEPLDVDRETDSAVVRIRATYPETGNLGYFIALQPDGKPAEDAPLQRPSTLLAFKRSETRLEGRWAGFPWQRARDTSKIAGHSGGDVYMNVGAFVIYIGKFPDAKSIRLTGSYQVHATTGAPGDGVVLINGRQVLRVPTGEYPYPVMKFDQDISSFAGKYALVEVLSDNGVRAAKGTWFNPRIVVDR